MRYYRAIKGVDFTPDPGQTHRHDDQRSGRIDVRYAIGTSDSFEHCLRSEYFNWKRSNWSVNRIPHGVRLKRLEDGEQDFDLDEVLEQEEIDYEVARRARRQAGFQLANEMLMQSIGEAEFERRFGKVSLEKVKAGRKPPAL